MAYRKLLAQTVIDWDSDYEGLQDDLAQAGTEIERRALRRQMAALAKQVARRMNQDIRTAQEYFRHHDQLVTAWVAEAQAELKAAKALAADYRKKPSLKELPPQIKFIGKKISDIGTAMDHDASDLGAAWFDYRNDPVSHVPDQYRDTFNKVRSQIMAAQKGHSVKREQIRSAQHEAEALVLLADKASMKANIKATGAGAQRPIGVAQQAARDVAAQMDSLYLLITHPTDFSPPPNTVALSATNLTNSAGQKAWFQSPNNLTISRGQWKNVETGYKLFVTKAGAMERTLATKKRSFRSNELSDATVKAQLAQAELSVKQAQALVKLHTANYKAAQKAIAKIEAGFKKKK